MRGDCRNDGFIGAARGDVSRSRGLAGARPREEGEAPGGRPQVNRTGLAACRRRRLRDVRCCPNSSQNTGAWNVVWPQSCRGILATAFLTRRGSSSRNISIATTQTQSARQTMRSSGDSPTSSSASSCDATFVHPRRWGCRSRLSRPRRTVSLRGIRAREPSLSGSGAAPSFPNYSGGALKAFNRNKSHAARPYSMRRMLCAAPQNRQTSGAP